MTIRAENIVPQDFMAIGPQLVADLRGDMVGAALITRLHYRAKVFGTDSGDGHPWWTVKQETLAADTGLSKDQVRRGLVRLLDEGHIERRKARRGSDQTLQYRVALEAPETAPLHQMAESHIGLTSQNAESPHVQVAESPSVPIEKKYKNTPPPPAETSPGTRSSQPDGLSIEDWFTRFWYRYPRKEGRKEAHWEFVRAVERRGAEPQVLLDAAKAYRRHCQSEGIGTRFQAPPSRWLREERWTDEYPQPKRTLTAFDQIMAGPPANERN